MPSTACPAWAPRCRCGACVLKPIKLSVRSAVRQQQVHSRFGCWPRAACVAQTVPNWLTSSPQAIEAARDAAKLCVLRFLAEVSLLEKFSFSGARVRCAQLEPLVAGSLMEEGHRMRLGGGPSDCAGGVPAPLLALPRRRAGTETTCSLGTAAPLLQSAVL